jgi:hypothetical protein
MMVLQQWTDGSGARKRYYNSHLQLSNLFLNFPMRQGEGCQTLLYHFNITIPDTLLYCRGESPFCADGLVSFSAPLMVLSHNQKQTGDSADQIAPCIGFVNKMDRQRLTFDGLPARNMLKSNAVAITLQLVKKMISVLHGFSERSYK